MLELMYDYYLWIKALHILSVIAWMAGLLYLPRLLVYHHAYADGTDSSTTFCTMERRLLKIITTPAMIASFITGLVLFILIDPLKAGWFHTKLLALFLMAGYHGMLSKWVREFAAGERPYSEKFFRMINEVPFLLAIVIVVMAVVKPF